MGYTWLRTKTNPSQKINKEKKKEKEMVWGEKQGASENKVLLMLKIHSRGQKKVCLKQPMRPPFRHNSLIGR